ncbi:MerR family transcriptional regulator [Mucilaginibacter sp. RS28]|uniref:MerR family transcriptional regulator n=1 Tax=Mucilaginibacter straminoryzae TaxID=2932774 RepID=A0A9X1X2B1_9SPHI|nr:MerR family transcriptional regulator [Mucilaginibacter straminoryzae]MCJ8209045.1 MerR family transcriptional regulator [Mucilaginibacter straminoryzae]
MNTGGTYSIKDLEKLSGIKAHTIRIWEKRYGIIAPQRTQTNIRHYTNEDLREILNISLLNKNGYKISAIAAMPSVERARHLSELSRSADDAHQSFEENLLLSLIEMDEAKFNRALYELDKHFGFEKAFEKVIFPFFEKIGVMWQTGTISPVQEHFFSNLIREKLIIATAALKQTAPDKATTAILLLPEGELHEIGLLFYNYALRSRGYKTIYLGQSVPLDNQQRIPPLTEADLIVTGITSTLHRNSFEETKHKLNKLFPGAKIYYTGPIPEQAKTDGSILTVKDLRALLDV